MNTGTRNLSKARAIAQELANISGKFYRVFQPYMPSVYPVGKSPYFIEQMPEWHIGKKEVWIKEVEAAGNFVARPENHE